MYSAALLFDLVGQVLDQIRAGQRIDGIGHAGFVGDDLLGAQRHAHGFLGRQPEGLVHLIGVQALRPAQHGGERLQRDAHHVVLGLLRGQRGAGGLGVEAQLPGGGFLRLETFAHDPAPTCGARRGTWRPLRAGCCAR